MPSVSAESEESLTWATAFLSTRQFILELHGEAGWSAVRDELRARHGIELPATFERGPMLPTRWFTEALNVGRDLFGPADFHERWGTAAAEYEMSFLHRAALRFKSPLWLFERGGEYWRRVHSTGNWVIDGRKSWLRGELRDFGVVDGGYCDALRAWLLRTCLMTGASRMHVVERTCRARGGDVCIFEGTW